MTTPWASASHKRQQYCNMGLGPTACKWPRSGGWSPPEPVRRGGGVGTRPESRTADPEPLPVSKSLLKASLPASLSRVWIAEVALGVKQSLNELQVAQHEVFENH